MHPFIIMDASLKSGPLGWSVAFDLTPSGIASLEKTIQGFDGIRIEGITKGRDGDVLSVNMHVDNETLTKQFGALSDDDRVNIEFGNGDVIASAPSAVQERNLMDIETLKSDHPDLFDKIRSNAVADATKALANGSDDPKFENLLVAHQHEVEAVERDAKARIDSLEKIIQNRDALLAEKEQENDALGERLCSLENRLERADLRTNVTKWLDGAIKGRVTGAILRDRTLAEFDRNGSRISSMEDAETFFNAEVDLVQKISGMKAGPTPSTVAPTRHDEEGGTDTPPATSKFATLYG